jgi:hypothetical protein
MGPLLSGHYTKARCPGSPSYAPHSAQLNACPIRSHETLRESPYRANAIRLHPIYQALIRGIRLLPPRADHSRTHPGAVCPAHHRQDKCFDPLACLRVAPNRGLLLLLPRICTDSDFNLDISQAGRHDAKTTKSPSISEASLYRWGPMRMKSPWWVIVRRVHSSHLPA